jgi:hypothetical protein
LCWLQGRRERNPTPALPVGEGGRMKRFEWVLVKEPAKYWELVYGDIHLTVEPRPHY